MGISKIFIICLYFFLFWITMVANKEIERIIAKWDERIEDLLEKFWTYEQDKHMELKTKYDNAERELKERDKQYRELLERTNKDND